jgi:hypothetical protein
VNPFVGPLLFLAGIDPRLCPLVHIRLEGGGGTNEIAAILNYDNTTLANVNARQSVIVRHNGKTNTFPQSVACGNRSPTLCFSLMAPLAGGLSIPVHVLTSS